MRFRLRLFTLLCTSYLLLASAVGESATPKSLGVGLSLTSYQLNKLATSASGKTSTFGTTFYNLQLEYHIPLTKMTLFSPRLNYMHESIHAVEAEDKGSKSSLNYLVLPFTFNVHDLWDFSSGMTIVRYTVKGKGGTIELDNGTGRTTFARPGRTVTSTTAGLMFGVAFNYKQLRSGLDLMVQGPFSAERRSLSSVLSCTWSFFK